MTLLNRTLLIAGLTLGTTLAAVADLEAGCGGGGYHRSYPRYSQPVYRPQPVYYQAPQPQPQPIPQPVPQPALQLGQQPAPQQPAAPQTANGQPVQTQQPQAPAAGNAQMSALEALAQMTGQSAPQAPATEPQAPSLEGNWTARLTGGAVVRLTLNGDGTFTWQATNKAGQVSTFQGTYSASNGKLTITRGSDNQKLEGALTRNGNGAFNFKLAGAQDNGLDFVRG